MERLIGGAAVDVKALHLGITRDALLEQIKNDPAFKDAQRISARAYLRRACSPST